MILLPQPAIEIIGVYHHIRPLAFFRTGFPILSTTNILAFFVVSAVMCIEDILNIAFLIYIHQML